MKGEKKMGITRSKIVFWGLLLAAGCCGVYYFNDLGIREIPLQLLQQKYEKPESKYITLDGTEVHYCDQGQGPALLLLHGFSDALQTWDGWVAAVNDHYRIIRPDLPGFGLTGPLKEGEYSKEGYIRFIDQFITKLNLPKVILVGNSLGGAIAWNYALRYPEKVDRMILIDPAGYPLSIPFPLKIVSIPVLKHISTLITPRFMFQLSLEQVLGDSRMVTPEMVNRFYELNLRPGNRAALVAVMDNLKQLNEDPAFCKAIAGIQTPTLLLWGEKDRWIPVSQVKLWQRDLPGIQTIVYQGVGHVPQIEIPGRSAADVHQWLVAAGAQGKRTPDRMVFRIIAIGCGCFCIVVLVFYRLRKRKKSTPNQKPQCLNAYVC